MNECPNSNAWLHAFPPVELLVTTDLHRNCPAAGYILPCVSSHPVKIGCRGHTAVKYWGFLTLGYCGGARK